MNEKYMKLEDENGIEKEYRILLVFKWYTTGKWYLVYTDKQFDLNSDYNIYANIFDPNDSNVFEDIKTDEEWDIINKKLKELKENNVK